MKENKVSLISPKYFSNINNNINFYYHLTLWLIWPHSFCICHNERNPLTFPLYMNRISHNKYYQNPKNVLFCINCITSFQIHLSKCYYIINNGNQCAYHLFMILRCKHRSFDSGNSFLFFLCGYNIYCNWIYPFLLHLCICYIYRSGNNFPSLYSIYYIYRNGNDFFICLHSIQCIWSNEN